MRPGLEKGAEGVRILGSGLWIDGRRAVLLRLFAPLREAESHRMARRGEVKTEIRDTAVLSWSY
jgi:hypothetical protein